MGQPVSLRVRGGMDNLKNSNTFVIIKFFFATDSHRQKPDKGISLTEIPESLGRIDNILY